MKRRPNLGILKNLFCIVSLSWSITKFSLYATTFLLTLMGTTALAASTAMSPLMGSECKSLYARGLAETTGVDCATGNNLWQAIFDGPSASPNIQAVNDGNLLLKFMPKCTDGSDDFPCFTGAPNVCADGTRPAIHIDPGKGEDKNKWIFWIQGGYTCTDGPSCWRNYTQTRPMEMSTAPVYAPAAKLSTRRNESDGILSRAPDNPFKDWTKIRIPTRK